MVFDNRLLHCRFPFVVNDGAHFVGNIITRLLRYVTVSERASNSNSYPGVMLSKILSWEHGNNITQ